MEASPVSDPTGPIHSREIKRKRGFKGGKEDEF